MRSIAISLCDNDFGSMFRPLLAAVREFVLWNPEAERGTVVRVVGLLIPGMYEAYQRYPGQEDDDVEDVVEHLQRRVEILFDEEAEAAAMIAHDSGSWFCDLEEGRIVAY